MRYLAVCSNKNPCTPCMFCSTHNASFRPLHPVKFATRRPRTLSSWRGNSFKRKHSLKSRAASFGAIKSRVIRQEQCRISSRTRQGALRFTLFRPLHRAISSLTNRFRSRRGVPPVLLLPTRELPARGLPDSRDSPCQLRPGLDPREDNPSSDAADTTSSSFPTLPFRRRLRPPRLPLLTCISMRSAPASLL